MIDNLLNFVAYFGFAVVLLSIFTAVYLKITPYDEFQLILEEGNEAAAMALIGAMLGFVLPIASVIMHSVSWVDFAIWGFIAALVQLTIGIVMTRVMSRFEELMRNGLKAAGILLGGLHLVVGVLNAASMTLLRSIAHESVVTMVTVILFIF